MTSSDDAPVNEGSQGPPPIALVNPFQLAQTASRLNGELDCARLLRLAACLAAPSGSLIWSARFRDLASAGGQESASLRLAVSGTLLLPCVRCLQPTAESLTLAFEYRLVRDEELASRLDQEQDDVDVLAVDEQFDLASLIEDELLMAIPLMPRHPKCPDGGLPEGVSDNDGAAADPERQFPFAGLADELARAGAPAPAAKKRKKPRN